MNSIVVFGMQSGQEEGESTPKQLEEVENVYARVARLEGENKKKEEKIQKLLENRKKMRDANSQLKGYQKSYQRQLDESHEEAIFNIKMLQEHFHKENKKMEGGKQKEIENIEQTLKRKENEAEIWKAQAIKMEKQLDDLMARVKIVAGFIAVVFIAWMCYIFLVAPALGAPNPSASAHSSFVISTKLTALMSIHWPENLKVSYDLKSLKIPAVSISSGLLIKFLSSLHRQQRIFPLHSQVVMLTDSLWFSYPHRRHNTLSSSPCSLEHSQTNSSTPSPRSLLLRKRNYLATTPSFSPLSQPKS